MRALAPLGEWTDWLFSGEVHEYTKLGAYDIKVLKGYTFGQK